MNNIHRIDGYGQLPPIGNQPSGGIEKQPTGSLVEGSQDQVQISQMALFLSKIATMPEIRAEKVESIRQALADGTYDLEGNLSKGLDMLLEEYGV